MRKIALLGFGTVGKGTYEILQAREKEIEELLGEPVKVEKVLVLKEEVESSGLPKDVVTTDYQEILEDSSIELIIEVTGAKKAGFTFMRDALAHNKHVVTANKAVVSAHYSELVNLAKEQGKAFLYEAAVGGGIPIITPFKMQSVLNKVDKIRGILNGTCNYLLWDMFKNGSDYGPTLKKCQELGYAEADPTDDVGGFDTARKLKILTSIALGAEVPEEDVLVEGIDSISSFDVEEMKRQNMTIKLLAEANIGEKEYSTVVEPTILPVDSPLAQIPEAINSIAIEGNHVGGLQFIGAGAGKLPTGNAIVNDILDALLNHDVTVPCHTLELENKSNEIIGKYYLRGEGHISISTELVEKDIMSKGQHIVYTKEISRSYVLEAAEKHRERGQNLFFAKISK